MSNIKHNRQANRQLETEADVQRIVRSEINDVKDELITMIDRNFKWTAASAIAIALLATKII